MPVKLNTFTNRINVGVRGLHLRAHLNAPAHIQARIIGQPRFGPDTNSHNHQISRQHLFAFQQDRLGFAVTHNRLGRGLGFDGDALGLKVFAQQIARRLVQLALH